jgi:hypothetical protein
MLTKAKLALLCALFATTACSLQKDPLPYTRKPDRIVKYPHATYHLFIGSHIIMHDHATDKYYFQNQDTMYQIFNYETRNN